MNKQTNAYPSLSKRLWNIASDVPARLPFGFSVVFDTDAKATAEAPATSLTFRVVSAPRSVKDPQAILNAAISRSLGYFTRNGKDKYAQSGLRVSLASGEASAPAPTIAPARTTKAATAPKKQASATKAAPRKYATKKSATK